MCLVVLLSANVVFVHWLPYPSVSGDLSAYLMLPWSTDGYSLTWFWFMPLGSIDRTGCFMPTFLQRAGMVWCLALSYCQVSGVSSHCVRRLTGAWLEHLDMLPNKALRT